MSSWKTAWLTRAVSKKTHRIVDILIISANILFLSVGCVIVLAISVLFPIKKFEIIPSSTLIYLFPGIVVIVIGMFAFITILVVTSGVLVIRNIKQTTTNVSRISPVSTPQGISTETQSFEKKTTSPFKITFGLMIGLILCVLLEIVSIGLAAGVSSYEEIKAVWQFFNCLGVLIYSILVLFLFYPLFLDSEQALKEIEKRNQLLKHNSNKSPVLSIVSSFSPRDSTSPATPQSALSMI